MKKSTKHQKKNKFNKTFKKIGGRYMNPSESYVSNMNIENNKTNTISSEGVIGHLGNKLMSGVNNVATIATDVGLKTLGLERKNKMEEDENKNFYNNINNVSNAATSSMSNISNSIQNVAGKTTAAVIGKVNTVLGSDTVKENVEEAAKKTAEILKDNAESFNRAINNPVVKEELVKAIDNAAEISSVAIEAAKKPIDKGIDVVAKVAPKVIGSVSSGAVKVATDVVGAVPGIGGLLDMMKAFNDGSKMVSDLAEATTYVVKNGSGLITETIQNFNEGMKTFKKNKEMGQEISNRTMRSINEFENPQYTQRGGFKTKRKLSKQKAVTKRVRFAF